MNEEELKRGAKDFAENFTEVIANLAEESEQEKLQRHGENDEPERVDNGQQHYEDMKSQYD